MDINPERLDVAARWVVSLKMRNIEVQLRSNRLWILPAKAYKQLTDEERAIKRHYLAEIKAIVRDGLPEVPITKPEPTPALVPAIPTPVRIEPTPEVYAYGHRVTEEDVRYALRCMGDEVLADYDAGRLSKFEAYQMTRRGLRQSAQFKSRLTHFW